MTATEMTDRCGRKRSAATMPGFRLGKKPGNWGKSYPADPLTPDEILLLLNGCSRTSATGARNRALIVVMWRSGLRVSEALSLIPGDIDHKECTVFVRRGKGAKARRVGIDPRALEDVRAWETKRTELGVDAHSPLFCTIAQPVTGGPLASSSVRKFLKDLAEFAGLTKRVHPHGFRHACAAGLAREGVPLALIQRQLGHSNPGTTGIYLQSIANTEVIDVMAARAWPGEEPTVGAATGSGVVGPHELIGEGVERFPLESEEWEVHSKVPQHRTVERAEIGQKLREIRLARGVSLRDVPEYGLGSGQISNLETGKSTPKLDTSARYAAIYGMEPLEFAALWLDVAEEVAP